jgi:hypothetical protein
MRPRSFEAVRPERRRAASHGICFGARRLYPRREFSTPSSGACLHNAWYWIRTRAQRRAAYVGATAANPEYRFER